MATMKQLWWTDWNQIELKDVEIPEVKTNEVKVAYAALCATDVHQVTMGVMGSKPPAPLGHEASGTIVELGEQAAAAGYKVGDKVTMFPVSHCGECEWCKKGMAQYCINAKPTGAFAEYVVTDVKTIYKLRWRVGLRRGCRRHWLHYAEPDPAVWRLQYHGHRPRAGKADAGALNGRKVCDRPL